MYIYIYIYIYIHIHIHMYIDIAGPQDHLDNDCENVEAVCPKCNETWCVFESFPGLGLQVAIPQAQQKFSIPSISNKELHNAHILV